MRDSPPGAQVLPLKTLEIKGAVEIEATENDE